MTELAKIYDPKAVEQEVYAKWDAAKAFHAEPAAPGKSYCIVIPPPNVTAALHLGHALNNTLQDVLIRHKRMSGFNTLWMPGTDHAGIATQTVVEKRILAEEGKRRTDFQRSEFVQRIQAWKDDYEARITNQLKLMGSSCDWQRQRFTMDETCAKAVRATFFKLFADGLIYRGKRLVNWDPATQTVLADDEVEHEEIKGHFYYLQYPLEEAVAVPRVADVSSARAEGVSPSAAAIEKRAGRYLPHWTQEGATYAVTFRLADAVAESVNESWRREREEIEQRAAAAKRALTHEERLRLHELYSARIESYLDAGHGSCVLKDPKLAEIVQNALLHFDNERYELVAWAVMPNHVHAIVRPIGEHTLSKTVQAWKSFTSKEINRLTGQSGQLWMEEYYDHLLRNEQDFNNQVQYILDNPAKAGLPDWTWSGLNRGQDARDTRGRDVRDTDIITHITVATTRPETMLGDTAVAMNPSDPRAKYLVGKMVRLPIVGRLIPIVADDHVVLPNPESDDEKARFSTGFLKVTPAHDPDDYAIGQRHDLPIINVMAPDGSISDKHGWADANADSQFLLGMDRFEARAAIVEWFRKEHLLENVRDYTHQVGHSYRSHVPIEPYLSDQWYVAVKKPIANCQLPIANCRPEAVELRDGVTYIKDTDVPVNSLAGLALLPLLDGRLKFTPTRYANNYRSWLENLRDWPISRQLWWGHQIPVWSKEGKAAPNGKPGQMIAREIEIGESVRTYVCVAPGNVDIERQIEADGFTRDTDVLDTWFSSALWPFSTLGWPAQTPELAKYYPGDVLCTAREIITLWVSRMVMMGQYCVGDIPFSDVFIHAMIQDGEGRKMSKSLGNGIDPLDIIASHGADAMRFTLVSMTTQTQDVRMPVEAMTLPDGRAVNSSPKFDIGRNFCNKLWNASRFAMMNVAGLAPWAQISPSANIADAWILSRLNTTVRDANNAIDSFAFNELADKLYHFVWDDFCDWYLEIAKGRINAGEAAPKSIVAYCLDTILRLLHPISPFITEAIWAGLNDLAPSRGPGDERAEPLLVRARFPQADGARINPQAEAAFATLQDVIRGIRNVRTQQSVPPSKRVDAIVEASGDVAQLLRLNIALMQSQAMLGDVKVSSEPIAHTPDAAAVAVGSVKVHLMGIVDPQAELIRLTKQQEMLVRGIKGIEGKVNNQGFLAKAPAEVVTKERQRLAGLQAELESVEKALSALKA